MSAGLPPSKGCRTTVILRGDVNDFASNSGVMWTGRGYAVPTQVAKGWLDPEAEAVLVLLSQTKGIEAYSTRRRLFTQAQRLAMIARDGGCTYPGCDAPPAYCEAHHPEQHARGGETSVANGALVCCGDHDHFETRGYRNLMLHGRPHWIPPTWIDPEQKPVKNDLHPGLDGDPTLDLPLDLGSGLAPDPSANPEPDRPPDATSDSG